MRHRPGSGSGRSRPSAIRLWLWRGLSALLLPSVLLAGGCSRTGLAEQAQIAWDNGDYEGAAALCEQFLKETPQSDKAAEIRLRVATICARDLRQYDRAIGHLIRFIEDHPTSPDLPQVRLRLAECYTAIARSDEAISEYETLLPQIGDENERRRLRLAVAELYYEKNDLRQAVVEYQKVVSNRVDDTLGVQAHLRIGQIRYLRDEFDEALPAYQAVIDHASDPELKRLAMLGKVDCLERVLQFDQAVAVLEGMAPDPKAPDSLTRRIAEIRERQRQRNMAAPASVNWSGK